MSESLPWLTEPFTSDRLLLRAARATDRDAVVELLTDPDAHRYLGGPMSEGDASASVSGPVGQRWGSFLLELREDAPATVVGNVSLSRERGELEIGYVLLPRFWGRGLGTEAVVAVLDWVARQTEDDHVVAVTQAANGRSLRLLAGVGFVEREQFFEYGAAQITSSVQVSRDGAAVQTCGTDA